MKWYQTEQNWQIKTNSKSLGLIDQDVSIDQLREVNQGSRGVAPQNGKNRVRSIDKGVFRSIMVRSIKRSWVVMISLLD